MTQKIGIIGGSGLYKIEQFEIVETDKQFQKAQETIYGSPSAPIKKYKMKGVDAELFFLARHGENHHLNPSEVPYRANILALQPEWTDPIDLRCWLFTRRNRPERYGGDRSVHR